MVIFPVTVTWMLRLGPGGVGRSVNGDNEDVGAGTGEAGLAPTAAAICCLFAATTGLPRPSTGTGYAGQDELNHLSSPRMRLDGPEVEEMLPPWPLPLPPPSPPMVFEEAPPSPPPLPSPPPKSLESTKASHPRYTLPWPSVS